MICQFVDGVGGSTLLDLNDGTNYWYLDGSEFPLPEVVYSWVENAQANGRRLADWRLGGNTITLKLCVKGTSNPDTYDKLRTLLKRFLKEGTLEIRMYGADSSVFYHTYPALPKLPDFAKKFVIDVNYMTNVTIEIPVDPEVKTSAVTLDVITPLGSNDDMEDWTGADVDGWTRTETNAGTVTEDTTYYLTGATGCRLTTTAGGTDVAAITDTAYIAVDSSKPHNLQVHCREDSGAATLDVDLLCYDAGNVLLGTLNLVTAYNPPTSDVWVEACAIAGNSVINAVGGAAPAFPATTTKVKRVIRNDAAAASVITIDKVHFAETGYLTDNKVSGAMGISIPGTDFQGDLPAKADVHIDVTYDRFTDLILGQRKEYSADYDPVQEPSTGTQAFSYKRRSSDYRIVTAYTNLLSNAGLETYSGSGATTDWDNWTETRGGGSVLAADTTYEHSGSACAYMHGFAILASDIYAVTVSHKHLLSIWAKKGTSADPLMVYAGFYTAGDAPISAKLILAINPTDSYVEYSGYIEASDFPATCAKCAVLIYGWSTDLDVYFDDILLADADITSNARYPIDSHKGRYIVTTGYSYGGSDTDDSLTVQALLETTAGLAITTSINPQVVDLDNPNTEFREVVFQDDAIKLNIPSHATSTNADLSGIEQVVRLAGDAANAQDRWTDHIAIIPYDRSYTEINSWADKDHLILDSRSSRCPLVSLDGTLDTSQIYQATLWQGAPEFEADPDGVNMTLIAIKDVSDDHELTPVVAMSLVYNPTYLLVT